MRRGSGHADRRSSRLPRSHLAGDGLAGDDLRPAQVVNTLQFHPEFQGRPEIAGQPQGGIRRNRPSFPRYFMDTGDGTRNATANAWGVIPSGAKNSSRNTSPG